MSSPRTKPNVAAEQQRTESTKRAIPRPELLASALSTPSQAQPLALEIAFACVFACTSACWCCWCCWPC